MQRFSQRESVLLGYSPQKTFMDSSSASEDVDVDFNDVFGGPPRRTSIQESRYSFGENRMDSSAFKRSDESVGSSRNPWSEKPVFGDEGLSSRRRHSRNDFFDDIFKGNEALSSSPRKYEMKDPFAPGSQLLSPVRPLPPKAEPFGSSFPAQFSLPAKLNRGMDLPTFGSPTRSSYKSKGSSSNGSNYYTFSPLSRFSGQANQGEEEVRNDFQSSYRYGALSQDLSTGIEDSTNVTANDGNETRANPKDDSNGSHFHFSIYKWADRGGVPLAIPLRGSERFKEKDKLQRCSSANGWLACETQVAMEPKPNQHGTFRFSDKMSRNGSESFRVHEKNENGSLSDSRNEGREPENNPMSESEVIKDLRSTENNVSADIVSHSSGNEGKTHRTVPHIDSRDEQEKEVPASGKETRKPLSLFFDDHEQGNDQKPRHSGTKETPKKNAKKLSEILGGKNVKKQDVKRGATPNNVEAIKTSVKGSPRNSWDNGKGRVKGKVKEFIKIFNQDAPSKPQTEAISESHNSKQKERYSIKPEKEPSINMTRKEEKNYKANLRKKKKSSDIPVANDIPKGANEKKINSSINDTVSDSSKIIVEEPVESLDDNFSIKDLTLEEKTLPQLGIDLEEIQAIDAKIRQWSNGKQGNIRSLLSTLQYVLWPDSGWKPVPLVDIIEGPSVKRSYQKALLCLHPDKLQQKGAASDKKYIAEKVFDILQDAWTHFSSLGAA